jgi:pantoate--beta-alanine ligase
MQVIKSISDMIKISCELKKQNKTIGFVPTMGYLHAGHESLLAESHQQNQITVLSIFVNPTQFNQASDFENYPIDLSQDLIMAEKNKVDYVFMPDNAELYSDDYRFQVQEAHHSLALEGEHRPGHFTGVLTVVLKLLNIIKPDKLYLGKKDYQQYSLIQDMISAFFLQIEVVGCETIREPDGLAMSSRNSRLSPQERITAACIHDILLSSNNADHARKLLEKNTLKVDYVTDFGDRRYVAAWVGETRLIDNVAL